MTDTSPEACEALAYKLEEGSLGVIADTDDEAMSAMDDIAKEAAAMIRSLNSQNVILDYDKTTMSDKAYELVCIKEKLEARVKVLEDALRPFANHY